MEESNKQSEDADIKKFLEGINSKRSIEVYRTLDQIRTKTLSKNYDYKYLCNNNVFEKICQFVEQPNEKIMSVALSILANVSLDINARKQISTTGIVAALVLVLKHVEHDSIQNRACRLAGNLALSDYNAVSLVNNKAVPTIVNILKTSKSTSTHQSAIRTLRIIWESAKEEPITRNDGTRTFVCLVLLNNEVFQRVADKLKSHSKDVVRAALRALAMFSNQYYNIPSIDQIMAVDCDNTKVLFQKYLFERLPDTHVVQIIYNIANCWTHGPSLLNTLHVIFYIIDALSKSKEKNDLLFYSLYKVCNTASGSIQLLRSDKSLGVFLSLLEESDESISFLLLKLLETFVLEPTSILRLTRFGLVRVLINKLEEYINKYGDADHKNPTSIPIQENDYLFTEKELPIKRSLLSPTSTSCASPSCSSGSASPQYSPIRNNVEMDEDSPQMAFYSPVCSDVELESNDGDVDGNDSFGDCDDQIEPTNPQCQSDDKTADTKYETIMRLISKTDGNEFLICKGMEKCPLPNDDSIIFVLLKISHIDYRVEDIVSDRTLKLLIKYLVQVRSTTTKLFYNLKAFFNRIISKDKYYCDLLNNYFVLEVQRMFCRPSHFNCGRCKSIQEIGESVLFYSTLLSESGLGEGQMAHKLLTSTDDIKLKVALTIPFVTKNPELLRKHLFKHKAMELLTNQLALYNTIESSSLEDVAYSLKTLFHNLGFINPKEHNDEDKERCGGCDVGKFRKESTIMFSLDDGTTVPANKTSLCSNSEVFDAMLNGSFKESNQNKVHIGDISEKCLHYFVKLIDFYCECSLPEDIEVLLELISVSDRYLIHKLKDGIMSYVMNHKLNYNNCETIYTWAKECQLAFGDTISNKVIKYIFTAQMTNVQLRKAVAHMMKGKLKDSFLYDMKEIIHDELRHESKRKVFDQLKYNCLPLCLLYP